MAEVAHAPVPTLPRWRTATLLSLVIAVLLLGPIALFNQWVFRESNVVILFGGFLIAVMLLSWGSVPRGIFFPSVGLCFALLAGYAWLRLDDPWTLDTEALLAVDRLPGSALVVDLAIYYFLFVAAALIYYRRPRLSMLLWFLMAGYVVAFVLRNSIDLAAIQGGYNLSPGFVLISMLPFVYLRRTGDVRDPKLVPYGLMAFCILWLAVIGARTAVASLLIFVLVLRFWPLIARNRFTYYFTFWGTWAFMAVLIAIYLSFVVYTGAGLVEDSDVGILQKGLGTRVDIWLHLGYLIAQQPWFGYGTDAATINVAPLQFMSFTFRRDNLSSHSVYFEMLYRLGAVGLSAFVLVLFSLWRTYWRGRHLLEVRVACAFILCLVFFNATGEFLMFSSMRLRSGFGWILLGIAAGACLRAAAAQRSAPGAVAR
jgi:hypothetical protein